MLVNLLVHKYKSSGKKKPSAILCTNIKEEKIRKHRKTSFVHQVKIVSPVVTEGEGSLHAAVEESGQVWERTHGSRNVQ